MDESLAGRRRSDGRFLWMFFSALAGLALGAALMWWGVFFYHDRAQAEAISHLSDQVIQDRLQLNELHAERGVLEGELAVERSTREALERTLGTVQQELGAARDQIAFFYELLPPGPDGSISIRGLDVQQKGDLLSFRVLLMRHGAGDKPFAGTLQFQATGRLDGEPMTVILEPARVRDAANPVAVPDTPPNPILALQFDQFQRSSGLLQVPEGLELESVTLNVLEGEILRVSRTMDIPVQRPVQ